MSKLYNYENDLNQKMKNKDFRKTFEKERHRLEIAYEILQLRKKHKISQKKLADRIGTTQSVIARIEAGKQNTSVDTLQNIASAFNRRFEPKFV